MWGEGASQGLVCARVRVRVGVRGLGLGFYRVWIRVRFRDGDIGDRATHRVEPAVDIADARVQGDAQLLHLVCLGWGHEGSRG